MPADLYIEEIARPAGSGSGRLHPRASDRKPARALGFDGWSLATVLIAIIIALPMLIVLGSFLLGPGESWDHLVQTVLPRYVVNSVILMLGVGLICAAVGTGAAWVVTMYAFPGARILRWALVLPLAVPTYLMAYVYTDILDVAGPVQTLLRDVTGLSPREYWFPSIRSLGGAIFIMGFVLYPYVYLLARAAFLEQSLCALEVARTLGRSAARSFVTVALPLARPAIAAGTALALMETLGDYGAVSHFGIQTFTTGIFRTWFGLGEPITATQLAAVLMLFAGALIILERKARKGARFHQTSHRYRELRPKPLRGAAAWTATILCAVPVIIGFAIPLIDLVVHCLTRTPTLAEGRLWTYAGNSLMLSSLTMMIAVALALVLAYGRRLRPTMAARLSTRVAALGYALPGSVVAVGVLILLAATDRLLAAISTGSGFAAGLFLSGSMFALIFAYVVRFLALSFQTVEAGLVKVNPAYDGASRTLGKTPVGTLLGVHAPMIRASIMTAGLLVFVEVMKELPATMIVRPFNLDTLAIATYRLASDERLAEAAPMALTIVLVSLIPVILLSRAISRGRPGNVAGC
ncbi:MAG: iron ABC transporter permease [Pseudomonadota bacterium]